MERHRSRRVEPGPPDAPRHPVMVFPSTPREVAGVLDVSLVPTPSEDRPHGTRLSWLIQPSRPEIVSGQMLLASRHLYEKGLGPFLPGRISRRIHPREVST